VAWVPAADDTGWRWPPVGVVLCCVREAQCGGGFLMHALELLQRSSTDFCCSVACAALCTSTCAPTSTTSTCACNNFVLQLRTTLPLNYLQLQCTDAASNAGFFEVSHQTGIPPGLSTPKSSRLPFFSFFSLFFLDRTGMKEINFKRRTDGRLDHNCKITCFGKLGGALAWAASHCRGQVRQDRGRQLTASTEG